MQTYATQKISKIRFKLAELSDKSQKLFGEARSLVNDLDAPNRHERLQAIYAEIRGLRKDQDLLYQEMFDLCDKDRENRWSPRPCSHP